MARIVPESEDQVRAAMADRLKRLRSYKRLTQKEVAGKAGVKRETYASYETGGNSIPSCLLPMLAEALGSTISYFYGEHGDYELYDMELSAALRRLPPREGQMLTKSVVGIIEAVYSAVPKAEGQGEE